MENEKMRPLTDLAFSCMHRNMDGAPPMKEIINAVPTVAGDEPIDEIVGMQSQCNAIPENPGKKIGRLDVLARTRGGEIVGTEVQLEWEDSSFERELFYGDKAHWDSLGPNMPCKPASRTRVISFMNFMKRKGRHKIVQPIKLMHTTHPMKVFSDSLRTCHVEIPKLTAVYRTLEDISGEEERNIGMDNFTSIYGRTNMDPKLRARYDYQMSVEHDKASRLASARDEGVAQGKEESVKKTALNLSRLGLNPEDIAEAVEFPLAQVKEWLGIS